MGDVCYRVGGWSAMLFVEVGDPATSDGGMPEASGRDNEGEDLGAAGRGLPLG